LNIVWLPAPEPDRNTYIRLNWSQIKDTLSGRESQTQRA
jgi:hypothetical protein